MTGKERILSTLNHEEPDRVAMDFGGTAVSGMHVTAVAALRDYYGLEKRPVKAYEPYQMLGEIEEDLLDALGIDTIGLPAPNTMFGFKNENWKEFRSPWGQELLVSEHFKIIEDGKGGLMIYPEGDTSVPPSGLMPAGGYFFDSIIRQEPIEDSKLNVEDNTEEFDLLSEENLTYFKKKADQLRTAKRAVVGNIGGTAIGDIALVPGPFMKHPKGIRDVSEWYMSTLIRQDYLHEIFSYQTDIAIKNLEKANGVIGDAIDVIFICGTDFGTQTSSFCSTETFDQLYAPYYKRMNEWIHQNTKWKTFKHSCGAVEPFLPHFIESGFDIVNPVQCSATGMDPTLPFGAPEQVREEVLSRCEVFAPGGGFVFNSIHNVQAMTPVENIVAMFEAVKEFNG
jgi:hypothetical protein